MNAENLNLAIDPNFDEVRLCMPLVKLLQARGISALEVNELTQAMLRIIYMCEQHREEMAHLFPDRSQAQSGCIGGTPKK